MPAFHLLRCMVALGGDKDNIVYRHRGIPIVFPELPILQFIHGEDAITDIAVVGQWETTNDEVLRRLNALYAPEVIKEVYASVRDQRNLPRSDASIPRCTLPVYKARLTTQPDSPDPKLRPLDQFTVTPDMPVLDAPPLPEETEPTPDEIAAHAQDDDDDPGFELPEVAPLPEMVTPPRVIRDTIGRGSSRNAPASRVAPTPDVNAGGSHAPGHVQQHRSRA
jgi:hypothetical protein